MLGLACRASSTIGRRLVAVAPPSTARTMSAVAKRKKGKVLSGPQLRARAREKMPDPALLLADPATRAAAEQLVDPRVVRKIVDALLDSGHNDPKMAGSVHRRRALAAQSLERLPDTTAGFNKRIRILGARGELESVLELLTVMRVRAQCPKFCVFDHCFVCRPMVQSLIYKHIMQHLQPLRSRKIPMWQLL